VSGSNSSQPYGVAIFCDDIREEAQKKLTYVGCYQGSLVIGADFPVALPKFAIGVVYNEPANLPVLPLKLRITWPGEPGGEDQVWEADLDQKEPSPDGSDVSDPDRVRRMVLNIVIAPLNILSPGMIRVRVYRDGLQIKLGSLKIKRGEVLGPGSNTVISSV
jgi:hypothetical protein